MAFRDRILGISRTAPSPHAGRRAAVRPDPDTPDDPDNGDDIPDVNPGSNPENPGDKPAVTEPGKPPEVVALRA